MILLDTSILIECLSSTRPLFPELLTVLRTQEPVKLCTLVMYEWLRGERTTKEMLDQEELLPAALALPFEAPDAAIAAQLYKAVRRARSREADLAIAACAIRHEARLWTLNRADFADIPGLKLYTP